VQAQPEVILRMPKRIPYGELPAGKASLKRYNSFWIPCGARARFPVRYAGGGDDLLPVMAVLFFHVYENIKFPG